MLAGWGLTKEEETAARGQQSLTTNAIWKSDDCGLKRGGLSVRVSLLLDPVGVPSDHL